MGKYTMEIITAHNGAEVISIRPTQYIRTELDEIKDAYKEQVRKIKQQHQRKSFFQRILRVS